MLKDFHIEFLSETDFGKKLGVEGLLYEVGVRKVGFYVATIIIQKPDMIGASQNGFIYGMIPFTYGSKILANKGSGLTCHGQIIRR